jgi:hypothetical protein
LPDRHNVLATSVTLPRISPHPDRTAKSARRPAR